MRAPRHAGRSPGSAPRSRPVRRGLAAALAAPLATTAACQAALTERNPASELIWWVGGLMFLVLVVILVVEVSDALWSRWRRLRGSDGPPSAVPPGETFHLRGDARPLRRRYLWRARPVRRTWGEGRTEADPEAER